MNLSSLVDEAAARFADRVSLNLEGRPATFADVADLATGGGRYLAGIGAQHVVYLGTGGPGFVLALLAAARAGVPFTPVNYRLAPDVILDLVHRFASPTVIADPEYAGHLNGHLTEGARPRLRAPASGGNSVVTVDEFIAQAAATTDGKLPEIDPAAVAVVLFTSGTTARPKAVRLRNATLHAFVSRAGQVILAEPGDTSLVAVPPYHIMGVTGVLGSFYVGRRMVFLPAFSPEEWLRLARAEAVTSATLVPTMVARLVRHLDGAPADVPSLKALVYGGSRMPRSVLAQALRAFPDANFLNGYGLTETNSAVTALTAEDHRTALASDDPAVAARLGSAGKAVLGVELQIRDAAGNVLDTGQVGELWVRGPQVSGEYVDGGSVLDPDGWFPTRDQAHLDDEGFLFVHGRADDTIIRGGENIAPAEIEDVLDQHPAVHAVAVVGLPDDDWGERIAAVVVARPGTTADELTAFVRERLRGSRTPDEIIFRDELPYTDTGKVQRRVLVAQLGGSSGGS